VDPDPGSSGSEKNIKYNNSDYRMSQTDKILECLSKMLSLKNINSFFQNKFPSKVSVSRRNMQPNTLTRRIYTGKIYEYYGTVLLENIYVESGSETI
jgi:uncharacterized protein YrrD